MSSRDQSLAARYGSSHRGWLLCRPHFPFDVSLSGTIVDLYDTNQLMYDV